MIILSRGKFKFASNCLNLSQITDPRCLASDSLRESDRSYTSILS
jgi:hypothetical protein